MSYKITLKKFEVCLAGLFNAESLKKLEVRHNEESRLLNFATREKAKWKKRAKNTLEKAKITKVQKTITLLYSNINLLLELCFVQNTYIQVRFSHRIRGERHLIRQLRFRWLPPSYQGEGEEIVSLRGPNFAIAKCGVIIKFSDVVIYFEL